MSAATTDTRFCLVDNGDELTLKTNHQYYYQVRLQTNKYIILVNLLTVCNMQVQAQLFCTEYSYCDFIVWTKADIFVERITPDTDFMKEALLKAERFFHVAVLPELIGHWFSRPPGQATTSTPTSSSVSAAPLLTSSASSSDSSSSVPTTTDTICYCQQEEFGTMVGCDSETCEIGWFHLTCLGLKRKPRSAKWYCPDCRKLKKPKK